MFESYDLLPWSGVLVLQAVMDQDGEIGTYIMACSKTAIPCSYDMAYSMYLLIHESLNIRLF